MTDHLYTLSKGELPALNELIDLLGLNKLFQGEAILKGCDPILASPHKLGEAVSYALLLNGVVASAIWDIRTGRKNNLSLNIQDAIHFLHPSHFVWQQGYISTVRADIQPANTHFHCRDGRQIWIQNGPPYPKLESGYLNFFNCGNNREAIAKAISNWNSFELEEKLAEIGLPGVVVRTREEWRAHPQGQLLLNTPVIEIEKIAEGKPYGLQKNARSPLAGINVADLTHVLAGPRSTMGLAEYGASVLHIEPSYHTDPKSINLGVNHGKKSAFCNLDCKEDHQKLLTRLKEADIFAQSYRHSVMEKFGLNAKRVTHLNPNGMIYLSINAFGHQGPWRDRPGFDQNAQMVSGFAATEGSLDAPLTSPVFYINDLLTGYFGTAAMMTALIRRATEGGSYHVKVSLTKSCMWAQDLGLIPPEKYKNRPKTDKYPERLTTEPSAYTFPPQLREEESPYGTITSLVPAVKFSNMPEIAMLPVVPFGSSALKF